MTPLDWEDGRGLSLRDRYGARREYAALEALPMAGRRVETYPPGRRCRCGMPLSRYNAGPLCNRCLAVASPADREAQG